MKFSSFALTLFAAAAAAAKTTAMEVSAAAVERNDHDEDHHKQQRHPLKKMRNQHYHPHDQVKETETNKKLEFRLEPNKLRNEEDVDKEEKKQEELLQEKELVPEPCEPAITKEELKLLLDTMNRKKIQKQEENEKMMKINLDSGLLPKSSCSSTSETSENSTNTKVCVATSSSSSSSSTMTATRICMEATDFFMYAESAPTVIDVSDLDVDDEDEDEDDDDTNVDVHIRRDLQSKTCNDICSNYTRPIVPHDVNNYYGARSLYNMLRSCVGDLDLPDFGYPGPLYYCPESFEDVPVNCWDVSAVTDFSKAFFRDFKDFNERLDCWDTSNGVNFEMTFSRAYAFNQNIDSWNVENATSMMYHFGKAYGFNQPLNSWNTGKVTTMQNMFREANNFNKDINSWDTSNVSSIRSMFYGAKNFNQPLLNWDTSNIVTMEYTFTRAYKFDQNINSWDTSNLKYMNGAFAFFPLFFGYYIYESDDDSMSFNQPLNGWDTSSLLNTKNMFYKATRFNQPLHSWDVSQTTDMSYMFYYDFDFDQCLANWAYKVPSEAKLYDMFEATSCYVAKNIGGANAQVFHERRTPIPNELPWCQEKDVCFRGDYYASSFPSSSPTFDPPPKKPKACTNDKRKDCEKKFKKKKFKNNLGRICEKKPENKSFGKIWKTLCPEQCEKNLCVKACPNSKSKKVKFTIVRKVDGEEVDEKLSCKTLKKKDCNKKDKTGLRVYKYCPNKCFGKKKMKEMCLNFDEGEN